MVTYCVGIFQTYFPVHLPYPFACVFIFMVEVQCLSVKPINSERKEEVGKMFKS